MPYVPTTVGRNIADLPRYTEQELRRIELVVERIEDALRFIQAYIRIEGVTISWHWDDSTVMADPGEGIMRGDSSGFPGMTQFALSNTDTFGQRFGGNLLPGTLPAKITVSNRRTDNFGIYTLTAVTYFGDPPVWALWDVTFVEGDNDNPQTGDLMEVRIQPENLPGEARS